MQKLKRTIVNFLTKHLLVTVVPEEVATIVVDERTKKPFIRLGKDQIADSEWAALSQEVRLFENTRLYQILFNTSIEHAKQRMFEKSKCDADMLFGKAMLYTKDFDKQIMKYLKEYKPR